MPIYQQIFIKLGFALGGLACSKIYKHCPARQGLSSLGSETNSHADTRKTSPGVHGACRVNGALCPCAAWRPGQRSQGRRTQTRGTSRRAGPVGEGGRSMPTALLLLSLVGSHRVGLLPMTEGRRPGDSLVTAWRGTGYRGHPPDQGGPPTSRVPRACGFPCEHPRRLPVTAGPASVHSPGLLASTCTAGGPGQLCQPRS